MEPAFLPTTGRIHRSTAMILTEGFLCFQTSPTPVNRTAGSDALQQEYPTAPPNPSRSLRPWSCDDLDIRGIIKLLRQKLRIFLAISAAFFPTSTTFRPCRSRISSRAKESSEAGDAPRHWFPHVGSNRYRRTAATNAKSNARISARGSPDHTAGLKTSRPLSAGFDHATPSCP